ncbi:MAG: hypothetical protein COU31_03655 [Candidatus Magasanikbacteria bacterium CG10_big_fil_rev_8_21_14_0_10_40_10]|uniref:EGF-like domain-containing protein n=1 Tax=Candidatus Magasanikbacteria bacterium CG10_big_fil_rev_8_21_14_0_10_40_10 TaxID=1974648 RepID=A0A2M6W3E2_9BACT|nr:MAG: hypothetical protein COU31_03655 [Candidatus Magasanikbacteria bacterium CG10_big_fil_rev_8_21_14_0_10_40_10]
MSKLKLLAIITLLVFILSAPRTVFGFSSLGEIRNYYSNRGLSGSGMEQEAIDNYLNEVRQRDQVARDQVASESERALRLYNIKLDYFYELDSIGKQIKDISGVSDFNACYVKSSDCIVSQRIDNPQEVPVDIFISYIPHKEKCINFLTQCLSAPKITVESEQSVYNKKCQDKLGSNSYAIVGSNSYSCYCNEGYTELNSQCITIDNACKLTRGQHSYYRGVNDANGKYSCDCEAVYKWNEGQTICILDDKDGDCKRAYGPYSNWTGSGRECGCASGYVWNESQTQCVLKSNCDIPNVLDGNNCITPDQLCSKYYGVNSRASNNRDESGKITCDCKEGYEWHEGKSCVFSAPELVTKEGVAPEAKQLSVTFPTKPITTPAVETKQPAAFVISSIPSREEEITITTMSKVLSPMEKEKTIVNPDDVGKKSRPSSLVENVDRLVKNFFRRIFRRFKIGN